MFFNSLGARSHHRATGGNFRVRDSGAGGNVWRKIELRRNDFDFDSGD